jgi:glycosyltransferase involved in cell wall biosynthesis
MDKRKILILTNHCGVFTGFGKNAKEFLTYAFKNYSDKYEFTLLAAGMPYFQDEFRKYPWKVIGTLPQDQSRLIPIQHNEAAMRMVSYGDMTIEEVVMSVKPSLVMAIEDEWGTNFIKNKFFFNKIPVIFWITQDSLPILEAAIDTASKSKYYWTWSEFASKVMREKHKLAHVKTQYPCINTSKFFRLNDGERLNLRKKHNIPEKSFITLFVFRNQLRKAIGKLLEGYSIFKKNHPEIKNTYIYTHTSYGEGWNIPSLCEQYGVNKEEVLCTYICRQTGEYFVMPFKGQDIDNPKIQEKGTLITVNVVNGVTDKQLNEIYNLADFYCHPATSGAAEIPIIEAALTKLPVATSNYSFGEDVINLNKGSISIEFDFYTEIQTHFLKSNQKPESIAQILYDFYCLPEEKRAEMGELSRKWAMENYDTEVNGKKIMEEIEKIPPHNWDFQIKHEIKNPNAQIDNIEDNGLWIKQLYSKILLMEIKDENDSGLCYWKQFLSEGKPRQEVESYFRHVALQENQKIQQSQPIPFESLIDNTGNKTLLLVLKESIGDLYLISSLCEDLKKQYNECDIYIGCDPQYFDLFIENPFVHKCLPFLPQMDQELLMTGQGDNKGLFSFYINLGINTQRILNYVSRDRIGLEVEV